MAMNRVGLVALNTAFLVATATMGMAQGVSSLVPHRAVYDLELKDAAEKAGIKAMRGRMVYEFTGSECEGFTVNFRFVTETEMGEEKRISDQRSTTFEDIRNGRFDFESKSYTDDRLDKEVQGTIWLRRSKSSSA